MSSQPEEDIDSVYERLLGRQSSEHERERLHRIRDVLGIGKNDALFHIVLVLEQYDREYRRYPALLAAETQKIFKNLEGSAAALVQRETQRAHASLASALAQTTHQLAEDRSARSLGLVIGWAALGLGLLTGSSMTAGYVLATGRAPTWASPVPGSPVQTILHYVLGAPAGWLAIVTAAIAVPVWWARAKRTAPSPAEWAALAALVVAGVASALSFVT